MFMRNVFESDWPVSTALQHKPVPHVASRHFHLPAAQKWHCWIDHLSFVIAPQPPSPHNDRSGLCLTLCHFAPAFQVDKI